MQQKRVCSHAFAISMHSWTRPLVKHRNGCNCKYFSIASEYIFDGLAQTGLFFKVTEMWFTACA